MNAFLLEFRLSKLAFFPKLMFKALGIGPFGHSLSSPKVDCAFILNGRKRVTQISDCPLLSDFLPLFFVPDSVRKAILVGGANDVMPNGPLRGSFLIFSVRERADREKQE